MKMKRLPDTEFEIMKVAWENEPPIRAALVMEQAGGARGWKMAPLLTMMNRLVEKGFLRSEKQGRDRVFYPAVTKEEYQEFEADACLKYHDNSPVQLFASLYNGKNLSDTDIAELIEWAKKKKG